MAFAGRAEGNKGIEGRVGAGKEGGGRSRKEGGCLKGGRGMHARISAL